MNSSLLVTEILALLLMVSVALIPAVFATLRRKDN